LYGDSRYARLFHVRPAPTLLSLCLLSVFPGCAGSDLDLQPKAKAKPSRGDLGVTFKTVDEAAKAGCAYIWNHEPGAMDREFCGAIWRDAEGIKAGLPEPGTATHCKRPLDPPGTTPEGGYHGHLRTSDFSRWDRLYATELARYLCTPGGVVLKMTAEGTVIVK